MGNESSVHKCLCYDFAANNPYTEIIVDDFTHNETLSLWFPGDTKSDRLNTATTVFASLALTTGAVSGHYLFSAPKASRTIIPILGLVISSVFGTCSNHTHTQFTFCSVFKESFDLGRESRIDYVDNRDLTRVSHVRHYRLEQID